MVVWCFGQQSVSIKTAVLEPLNATIQLQHYGVLDGLPSNVVNDALHGRDGFIWLGTREGLVRFDGTDFKVFTHKEFGFGSNDVLQIGQIEDDWLVLICADVSYGRGLGGGIWRFNTLNYQTEKLESKRNVAVGETFGKFIPFNDTALIISAPANYYHTYSPKLGLRSLNIRCIGYREFAIAPNDIIWRFVDRADIQEFSITSFNFNGEQLEYHADFFHIKGFTKDNRPLGFDTRSANGPSLVYLSEGGEKTTIANALPNGKKFSYSDSNPLGSFTMANNQYSTWYNQKELGCFRILGSGHIQPIIDTARAAIIPDLTVISVGNSGNDFIVYSTAGFYQLRILPNQFKTYLTHHRSNHGNSIRGISSDEDGNVYVSVGRKGCYKIDSLQRVSKFSNVGSSFSYIHSNSLFISSNTRVYKYNLTSTFEKPNSLLLTGKIWSAYQDKNSTLYLGLEKDLVATTDFENYSTHLGPKIFGSQLNRTVIYQIFEHKDSLWFTTTTGLYWYHSETAKWGSVNINGHEHLDLHHVLVDKNTWWLATNGRGLIKWSRPRNGFTEWTVEDGLSSNVLHAILTDDFGSLWISSDYGLMRFRKENEKITTYTTKNGIPSVEFNRISYHNAPSGHLYFGGINGLIGFHPSKVPFDDDVYEAPLQIIAFSQYNERLKKLENRTIQLKTDSQITVEPTTGFFTLKCRLLDFTDSKKRYAYRFGQIDKEWTYLDDDELQIGDLPYGQHQLELKGQNQAGQWSIHRLHLDVVVHRPFYLHWWFILLSVVIVGGSSFGFILIRTRRLKREQQRLQKKVKEQTAQISQSLKEKELLLKEVHHRVKNNLQITSSLLNLERTAGRDPATLGLLEEARNRIQSMALIHKNLYQYDDLSHITVEPYLTELVNGLHDTYRDADKNVTFHIESTLPALDVDQAIPMGLIITELVSNSYKYAFINRSAGHISIRLSESPQHLILEVGDNGIGFTLPTGTEENSSLGLRIVRLLSKQLKGTYHVNNKVGTHYIFEFRKTP